MFIIIEVIDTFYDDDYYYYNLSVHSPPLKYSYNKIVVSHVLLLYISLLQVKNVIQSCYFAIFLSIISYLFFISESHSVPQKVLWWKRSSMKHQLPFQSIRNALLAIITHITRYPYTKTETIHTTNQMTLLQMPQPVQALTIAGSRKCSKKSEYNKFV